jgi:hypothetical protein
MRCYCTFDRCLQRVLIRAEVHQGNFIQFFGTGRYKALCCVSGFTSIQAVFSLLLSSLSSLSTLTYRSRWLMLLNPLEVVVPLVVELVPLVVEPVLLVVVVALLEVVVAVLLVVVLVVA